MTGPSLVQDWLRQMARRIAGSQKSITWKTPVGFRVVQDYRRPLVKRRKASDFTVSYYLHVDGKRPSDKRQQVDSIVANYVHSMDAAHLIKTVNRLAAEGISNVGVVHDSFGVHATHLPLLNKVIREEFVDIYKDNVLDVFITELSDTTGLALIPFKHYGNLDV